jgi:hypothetical protein
MNANTREWDKAMEAERKPNSLTTDYIDGTDKDQRKIRVPPR